jgi:hypothetical protein
MRRIGDTFGESSLAESACGESEARPLGIFENLDLGPSFGTAFFFSNRSNFGGVFNMLRTVDSNASATFFFQAYRQTFLQSLGW